MKRKVESTGIDETKHFGANLRRLICSVERTKSTRINVTRIFYKGKDTVDIRLFFKFPDSDEWKPSRKGVNIPLALVNEIAKALIEASEITLDWRTDRDTTGRLKERESGEDASGNTE